MKNLWMYASWGPRQQKRIQEFSNKMKIKTFQMNGFDPT